MTIEIANRLVELRKKSGLSQEELAEKLGISRQSVSKWERAESSPDTDNLICLAKIYGVSLDDLLNTDQDVEEIARDKKEELKTEIVDIAKKFEDENEDDDDEPKRERRPEWIRRQKICSIIASIVFSTVLIMVATGHIVLAAMHTNETAQILLRGWWTNYFLSIVFASVVTAIGSRKFSNFIFPILSLWVFLFVGMYFGVWHPTWIVFVLIPVYYAAAGSIDYATRQIRREKKFLNYK